jgi:mRNA interferase RelE/StbE
LAWKIEFSESAIKQLAKLDKSVSKRIIVFLEQKVGVSRNPRSYGRALKGGLNEYWRYRVGDYRIITSIDDDFLRVLVLRLGPRKDIYKQH